MVFQLSDFLVCFSDNEISWYCRKLKLRTNQYLTKSIELFARQKPILTGCGLTLSGHKWASRCSWVLNRIMYKHSRWFQDVALINHRTNTIVRILDALTRCKKHVHFHKEQKDSFMWITFPNQVAMIINTNLFTRVKSKHITLNFFSS